MLKSRLAALAFTISTAAAQAATWDFYYGPEYGAGPMDSYAQVVQGENALIVHAFGDSGSVALSAMLQEMDPNGPLKTNLAAKEDLTLEVVTGDERYSRIIDIENYRSSGTTKPDETQILFLLLADDMFAMAEADALFLKVGSMQYRFDLDDADIALGKFVSVMREAMN